jgi:hypothetical protein
LKIELLYFEGCPGSTKVLGILERVIAEEGLATEILPVTPDPEGWSGYLGIPMILVDGEELFPVEHHDLRAATCRIYATPEGQKNYPTAAMVREALAKRSPGGQHRSLIRRPPATKTAGKKSVSPDAIQMRA